MGGSSLKKSKEEGWPIQCFEFPDVDPILLTLAVTGTPKSSPVFPITGIYLMTTPAPIQALKDATPSTPDPVLLNDAV